MKVGDEVENFQIRLLGGSRTFDLHNTLINGPVVLNFIMGTWCPFCAEHIKRIRSWQISLKARVTMLIISSESEKRLMDFVNRHNMIYLFASDSRAKIIDKFNVKKLLVDVASPATFLIDSDKKVKIVFKGVRTDKTRKETLNKICEVAGIEPESEEA